MIELPRGATPIDFAYHIHTKAGHRCCRSAKADGVIVPLGSELANTQVVEILTASNAHPNLCWLQLARTSRARTKIRQWLIQNDPDLILDRSIVTKKSAAEQAAEPKLLAPRRQQRSPDEARSILDPDKIGVRAGGYGDLMVSFARCCSPVSGDPIAGYVSRGKGITVHRADCHNLLAIHDVGERPIDVAWESTSPKETFSFLIVAGVTGHLFSEIESGLCKIGAHLIAGKLEEDEEATQRGMFTVEVEPGTDQVAVLKSINAILAVYRIEVA